MNSRHRQALTGIVLALALLWPTSSHAAAGCVSPIAAKTTLDPHGTRRWRPTDGAPIVCDDGAWVRWRRPGKNRSVIWTTFDPIDAMEQPTK